MAGDRDRRRQHAREQSAKYQPYFINEVLPYNFMLPEESETFAKHITDINKHVSGMLTLWISGDRDVEADWPSTRSGAVRWARKTC